MDTLDTVAKFVIAPIAAVIWWAFKKYDDRIVNIEKRMNDLEKETAVMEAKLDGLKEGIDEIKAQLNQLFDLLRDRK